jgi:hypothetical protein
MAQNAISVTPAATAARRSWWNVLRADDPRYPLSKALATLRNAGKLGWLPVTVYLGNAASGLITAVSTQGIGATMSMTGLAHTLQFDGVLAFTQRTPVIAAVILGLVAIFVFLIRQAHLDAWREAAVVSSREIMRLMEERAARTMTAESLRDDLRQLQTALAADTVSVAKPPSEQPSDIKERLARLTEISEMLSRDLAARAMWDELMDQRMTTWQRRQRLWSAGMGAATIAIGGLLPVLLNAGTLG